jgi:exodeoxyribonuclease VII large subunit
MAVKRQQILKKLEDEGVLTMNKELDFPVVPQRVAVISSKNAAGYTDFINHLTGNSYGYKFYTCLIETTMQGNETESGVIKAFDKIASNIGVFDVVVIIRGGGSQTDLSWFDNYKIAYYITQFPIPVITGIGHEKDLSVTDIVAYQSLKTPTAVADYLIDYMTKAEEMLMELGSEIVGKTRLIFEEINQQINSFRLKLVPLARLMISEIKEELSGAILDMINIGKGYILRAGVLPSNQKSRLVHAVRSFLSMNESEIVRKRQNLFTASGNLLGSITSRIMQAENSLKILDPVNVLKRGYTITSYNGQIIKSAGNLKEEDIIVTRFVDGMVRSKVVDKKTGGNG